MSRKVQSIRGETVDFDLIDIKNKIMTAPTPDTVQQRERFIDKRRRRNSRKRVDEMLAQQQINEASVRAVIDDKRQKNDAEKNSKPHVVVNETVVTNPSPTPEGSVESDVPEKEETPKAPRRKIKRIDPK